jgi:hypothetical protein
MDLYVTFATMATAAHIHEDMFKLSGYPLYLLQGIRQRMSIIRIAGKSHRSYKPAAF